LPKIHFGGLTATRGTGNGTGVNGLVCQSQTTQAEPESEKENSIFHALIIKRFKQKICPLKITPQKSRKSALWYTAGNSEQD
jgi:hypothetical protein